LLLEIIWRLGSNELVYSYRAEAIVVGRWFRLGILQSPDFPVLIPGFFKEMTPMTTSAATDKPIRQQPTIREISTGERPSERPVEYGSKNLSNTELIAILLRTGYFGENVIRLSSRLLTRFGGLAGLGKAAFAELCAGKGLCEAKACQLLATLEFGHLFVSLALEERIIITTPQDAAELALWRYQYFGLGAPARYTAEHP